jgi:hypothetical protein
MKYLSYNKKKVKKFGNIKISCIFVKENMSKMRGSTSNTLKSGDKEC